MPSAWLGHAPNSRMLGRLPPVTRAARKAVQLAACRHIGGVGGPILVPDRDRIHLNGLVFHGYHGVLPEENRLGQKFVVDAVLQCDLERAGLTDELDHTVNYAAVYKDIQQVMEGPPHKLLESVAEDIAAGILEEYALVSGVRILIKKPHVAVGGVVKYLGIEIERRRVDLKE